METKYDVLFKEFKQFYQELDEANPGSKDITKSKQFKLWKKNQKSNSSRNEQIPQRNDDQNEQILQPNDSENDSENEQIPQRNDDQNEQILQPNDSENDSENEQIPQRNDDILNEALDGPLSPDNISIDQMDNLLREMINDLQRDDDTRALLNNEELFPPQQEDEGIDLDIEMEIDDPLQEELLW